MDIENKLGTIFSNVIMEIISTISGFSLDVLSQEKDNNFDEMTGVMNLSGKKSGMLFISIKEADMRLLCSYMIGVPQDELTQNDVEDALCELVNMTAGSAKLRLSDTDYVFSLSAPFLLKSQGMNIVVKNKTRIISKVIGNNEVSLRFKVVH